MATRKWGSETLVNTRTAGSQFDPAVTALAGGGYVVVWQNGSGPGSSIRFQRFDAEGQKAGGETTVVGSGGNIYQAAAVTALNDGSFWVAYTHDVGLANYIEGSVYRANGTFLREQFSIYSFGKDNYVDVAAVGKGSASTWYDPKNENILLRVFDEKGVAPNANAVNTRDVTSTAQPKISTSLDGRTFTVVWDDYDPAANIRSLHARVFDKNGNTLTNVYTKTARGIGNSDVVWLNDRSFAILWADASNLSGDKQVKLQVFGYSKLSLTTLSDVISIGSITYPDKYTPALALLPDGGLAVAWNSNDIRGIDSSSAAVHLQAFDKSGNKIGGDIVVNTTTASYQEAPSITALADGRVVVTWTDGSLSADDSSGSAIRSQIIDPRDGIVAGSDRSDTLYGHEAVSDEISGGNGSDRMSGLGGNDSIYGGAGDDTAIGGRGDDTLRGGAGNDILNGGRGNDSFVFDTALSAKTNVDAIADFTRGQDEIQLDNAIFTALPVGDLAASAFKDIGRSGFTLDADDRILYNSKSGNLAYDPDGSGKAPAVLFAHLDNQAALTAADFLVV